MGIDSPALSLATVALAVAAALASLRLLVDSAHSRSDASRLTRIGCGRRRADGA